MTPMREPLTALRPSAMTLRSIPAFDSEISRMGLMDAKETDPKAQCRLLYIESEARQSIASPRTKTRCRGVATGIGPRNACQPPDPPSVVGLAI